MYAKENSFCFYMDFNHVIELSSTVNIKVSTTMSVWSMVSGTVACVVVEVNANILELP